MWGLDVVGREGFRACILTLEGCTPRSWGGQSVATNHISFNLNTLESAQFHAVFSSNFRNLMYVLYACILIWPPPLPLHLFREYWLGAGPASTGFWRVFPGRYSGHFKGYQIQIFEEDTTKKVAFQERRLYSWFLFNTPLPFNTLNSINSSRKSLMWL